MSSRHGVLMVVVEDHFFGTPEGVFTTYAYPYEYWHEYLAVFDQVRPFVRLAWRERPEPNWLRADGPGVRFMTIPDFRGFRQILARLPGNLWRARAAVAAGDYFLLTGGNMSALVWAWLRVRRTPYARAVIGHEGESVALVPDARRFRLASLFARLSHALGRTQVREACAVNYWSRNLRGVYPPGRRAPSYFIPEIQLGAEVVTGPRTAESFSADPLRMVSAGRMYPEKGYRQLVEALRLLDASGRRNWSMDAIGPGPELEQMRTLAQQRGLADRLSFPGLVPWGPELFARLDRADLYVLPSLTEGMPRAILEAMARGLPAAATSVGGIPDILPAENLARPGDPAELATLMGGFIGARERLTVQSQHSFRTALSFRPELVRPKKHAFWIRLRDCTDRWRTVTQS